MQKDKFEKETAVKYKETAIELYFRKTKQNYAQKDR